LKIYHAVGLTSYLTDLRSMDSFRRSTSIIFPSKPAGSAPDRPKNNLISVIYNVTTSSHDAAGCGETIHSAHR